MDPAILAYVVQAVGGAVHHFAPGPKAVFDVPRAVFGATADHTLKSVGVCINQTRKDGGIAKVNIGCSMSTWLDRQNFVAGFQS